MSSLFTSSESNHVWVKICGLTSLSDALAALEAGADALGFILYPKSSRYIRPEAAMDIIARLPKETVTVAVTVNDESLLLSEQLQSFSMWQLHGKESPEICSRLAEKKPVMKAVPGGEMTQQEVTEYESSGVSAFLLDTPSAQHGGTGRTFNWEEALRFGKKTRLPMILSGGLSTQNLENALELVHPDGVDVCSGVELAPGVKDTLRMKQFIKLCKKC